MSMDEDQRSQRGTAVGVFASRERADATVDELLNAGFSPRQIGLALPDAAYDGSGAAAASAGASTDEGHVGATSFSGMGIAADQARHYEAQLGAGCAVVAVTTGSRYEDAVRILRDYGARFLDERPLTVTGYDTPVGTAATAGPADPAEGEGLGAYTSRPRSWNEVHHRYRRDWEERYGGRGPRWEQAEPGYRYGHEMAADERFAARDWAGAEPELRAGFPAWTRAHGYGDDERGWERNREHVRHAFARGHAGGERLNLDRPIAEYQRPFHLREAEARPGDDRHGLLGIGREDAGINSADDLESPHRLPPENLDHQLKQP